MWCNSRPQEDGYPVQMQFTDVAGHLRALPPGAAAAAQRTAAEGQLLAGRTLLWLPPSRDASLQAAAALLGAANHNVAASGRAPAAAKAAGAVLVRGRESDAVPAAYSHLFWTTAELLIVRAPALLHWLSWLRCCIGCHGCGAAWEPGRAPAHP